MSFSRRVATVSIDPFPRPGLRGAAAGPAETAAFAAAQRIGWGMDDAEDEILVERVAEGDDAAYRTLMDRHLRRCIGMARRMTGNTADAEDVAQEAFLRLWRRADQWRPGMGKFTTWFYRIVINLCIDNGRRRRMLPLEDAGDPADERPDAQASMEEAETATTVANAVARLPERQRAALTLRYYEGVGNIETARILGISVDAVESLLLRARRALRTELASFAPSQAKEET